MLEHMTEEEDYVEAARYYTCFQGDSQYAID